LENGIELRAIRSAIALNEELADAINVLSARQISEAGDRLDRHPAMHQDGGGLTQHELPAGKSSLPQWPERCVIIVGRIGEICQILGK